MLKTTQSRFISLISLFFIVPALTRRLKRQGRENSAVVTSEVCSLAQRSATSAPEIKKLIEDSVADIAMGSQLEETAGSTMDELMLGVNNVATLMSEIMSSSQQQSLGIELVNIAITNWIIPLSKTLRWSNSSLLRHRLCRTKACSWEVW